MITKNSEQDEKLRQILERLKFLELAVGNGDESSMKIFEAIKSLGLKLKPMIEVGLGTSDAVSQFIKKNYGFAKTLPDGSVEIDYSKIIVSEGVGKGLLRPKVTENVGAVYISWETTGLTQEELSSYACFCIICPTGGEHNLSTIFHSNNVETCNFIVDYDGNFPNEKVYIYGFTMTENKVVSSSQFLGEVTIKYNNH